MAGTSPTLPTSPRASAHFFRADSPAAETHTAQASASTRLDEDEALWRKLKVEGRRNLCAPTWFSESEVSVNASKIRCAKNECAINVATSNGETQLPIHAHSVNQLPLAESSCDRAAMTYAAGQSPTQDNYKNMLIQGIESGLGTFQMVSTKAHRHGSDSKETPLIKLLEAALNNPSKTVDLSDRYAATNLEKIAGDFGRSDDHVRYVMTVRDKQNPNKLITVPLTQAALPFTDKVLQADKIERAHDLMQAHCDESEKQAKANGRTSKWKDLMVLSHAGYGRNATVITYCRIAALATQSADSVNKNNLCEKLKEAITTGMASRDPNFVHSRLQMSALRVALERKVLAHASERLPMSREGDARGRRHVSLESESAAPAEKAATTSSQTSIAESVHASAHEAAVSPGGIAAEVAPSAAHLPAVALTEHQQKVVLFYEGKLSYANDEGEGVNIGNVKKYTTKELEEVHHFIQPLFPIDTVSGKNKDAPALDGQDFLALRSNTTVSKGLDEAFDTMLKFFGLKWEGKNIVVHDRKSAEKCFMEGNHNTWRATRIIRSMTLFGKTGKAKALQACLKDFCKDYSSLHDSIKHWDHALNDPVLMNKLSIDQPGDPDLLFPNKSLLDSIGAPQLGSIKQTIFDKQQQFYEAAYLNAQHAQNTATPLIACFTSQTIIDGYASDKHLEERFNPPNPCRISSQANFYFDPAALRDGQSPQHPTYVVHVDFANQTYGGSWKHDGSFAQEEVAFIENIGLGRVANVSRRSVLWGNPSPEKLRDENIIGYRTRLDKGVPSPIIIEGCERVAHLIPYGRDAAMLKEKIVEPDYFSAVTTPQVSNWLAIAAPDYQELFDRQIKVEERETIWMSAEFSKHRTDAFYDLFRTAHAGFSMAKKLAGDQPLKLHTGQLGCGVFKNNLTLSIAAQLLAARVVGVDTLHFHGVASDDATFEGVRKIVEECTQKSKPGTVVKQLVDAVLEKLPALVNRGVAA